jgi:hypothetical protein
MQVQHLEGGALLCRPAVAQQQQGSCDAMPL